MPGKNRRQTFGLWHRSRKPIENETVPAVQPQPVFNQFTIDFIRDQSAMLMIFGSLQSQRCPEIFFSAQNRARRSDWNSELARNHFRLGSFPGTRRAEKNESPFHSCGP